VWLGWRPVVDLSLGVCDLDAWRKERPELSTMVPASEPGEHNVSVVDTRKIVPSDALPPEAAPGHANNNLDVARHDGRVFLAWRTAPDHFASIETRIVVVSSRDEKTFHFEKSFTLGRDLREPRLLSFGGSLFLYVTRLGTSRYEFEPDGVSVAERKPDGTWTDLEPLDLPGHIAWRTRVEAGKAYMVAYDGGDQLYRLFGSRMKVELLTTDDGRKFRPASGKSAVVSEGGGSEAYFALDQAGKLFSVIRNEAGDDTGFGSKICSAPSEDIAHWECKTDPRKFDSPLVFHHDGEIYLLARRNVTASGNFDLDSGIGMIRAARNQLSYSNEAKRCSLWRFDRQEMRIAFVLDLPSKGDTCFPGIVEGETPDEVAVYDYSSDIDGPDVPWRIGQRRPTFIYRHVLRFEKR
jgi:hypothetical protein